MNDKTISFILGFTGRSTVAVRKDLPGRKEFGTIDISTGAYRQIYSSNPYHEILGGPELSPDGTHAIFVEQENGPLTSWTVLDMATGQLNSLNPIRATGGIVAWTPSYILFYSVAGLIEVNPATGAQSPVANSSDYDTASPDGTHLAGVVHRDLGDPEWCMNTVVTTSQTGDEVVVAAGKNRAYRLFAVTNTGDMLTVNSDAGPACRVT